MMLRLRVAALEAVLTMYKDISGDGDCIELEYIIFEESCMKHVIDVSSSSLELRGATSLRLIKLVPTLSSLTHSTSVNYDHLFDASESPILGILNHTVIANDLTRHSSILTIEIMRFEDVGDDLGHVESFRISFHDNCDISGPLSIPA